MPLAFFFLEVILINDYMELLNMNKQPSIEKTIIDQDVGGTMIIHQSPNPDPNAIVIGVFGISLNQFIRDIQLNSGGKYDELYKEVYDA